MTELPRNLSAEDLRIYFAKNLSDYDALTETQRKDILRRGIGAHRPHPVEFGLTYSEVHRRQIGESESQAGLKYKDEPRSSAKYSIGRWLIFILIWGIGSAVLFHLDSKERDWLVEVAKFAAGGGIVSAVVIFFPAWGISGAVGEWISKLRLSRKSNKARPRLLRYEEAVRAHQLYEAASYDAKQAVLRTTYSYWALLDGYEFENATAEVLRHHQFSARVTRGSADGGVDIELVRAGRRGVVQCKAHSSRIGPHTVRDLYGVIHHAGTDFGIIISRGGFTKGAIDFAKDKPIFLISTEDLIAMQEGKDVLRRAFERST